MGKINTVLFDWDGTIAETLEVWLCTFKKAYAKVGVYPSDKEIASHFGKWDAYIELGVKPDDVDIYNKQLETVYKKLESVKLYPGAEGALVKLKNKGYKIGLVSTSTRKMLDTALANNKIKGIFDVIVSADDTNKHKPDPTPIFIAAERLDVRINDIIFVGDSDKDIGAAHNAGTPMLLFTPEKHALYYDLNKLKSDPSISSSFDKWDDFPIDELNYIKKP